MKFGFVPTEGGLHYAESLEQVRQATEMRWQYMSGLHRAYVLKEDL